MSRLPLPRNVWPGAEHVVGRGDDAATSRRGVVDEALEGPRVEHVLLVAGTGDEEDAPRREHGRVDRVDLLVVGEVHDVPLAELLLVLLAVDQLLVPELGDPRPRRRDVHAEHDRGDDDEEQETLDPPGQPLLDQLASVRRPSMSGGTPAGSCRAGPATAASATTRTATVGALTEPVSGARLPPSRPSCRFAVSLPMLDPTETGITASVPSASSSAGVENSIGGRSRRGPGRGVRSGPRPGAASGRGAGDGGVGRPTGASPGRPSGRGAGGGGTAPWCSAAGAT